MEILSWAEADLSLKLLWNKKDCKDDKLLKKHNDQIFKAIVRTRDITRMQISKTIKGELGI